MGKNLTTNLVGSQFHELTILEVYIINGFSYVKAKCSCGNLCPKIRIDSIKYGKTKSCGHLRKDFEQTKSAKKRDEYFVAQRKTYTHQFAKHHQNPVLEEADFWQISELAQLELRGKKSRNRGSSKARITEAWESYCEDKQSIKSIVSYKDTNIDGWKLEVDFENKCLNQRLFKAISVLRPREQLLIKLRYGFEGHPYTLQEIAERLKLTRERIRQIEISSLRKLRNEMELSK